MFAISLLFYEQNPTSTLNKEATELYKKEDKTDFNNKVKEWINFYAEIENEVYKDKERQKMNDLTRSENMPINKVDRIGDNNLIWKFVFNGPEATAYEDGIFTLKFIFPNDYPTGGLKLYL